MFLKTTGAKLSVLLTTVIPVLFDFTFRARQEAQAPAANSSDSGNDL